MPAFGPSKRIVNAYLANLARGNVLVLDTRALGTSRAMAETVGKRKITAFGTDAKLMSECKKFGIKCRKGWSEDVLKKLHKKKKLFDVIYLDYCGTPDGNVHFDPMEDMARASTMLTRGGVLACTFCKRSPQVMSKCINMSPPTLSLQRSFEYCDTSAMVFVVYSARELPMIGPPVGSIIRIKYKRMPFRIVTLYLDGMKVQAVKKKRAKWVDDTSYEELDDVLFDEIKEVIIRAPYRQTESTKQAKKQKRQKRLKKQKHAEPLDLGTFIQLMKDEKSKPIYIHDECRKGNILKIEHHIDNGADIEIVRDSKTALLVAIENKKERVVKFLLDRGANPNHWTELGHLEENPRYWSSPLTAAVCKGNVHIVEMLIAAGADVNQKVDDDGVDGLSGDQTPLLYAIQYENFKIAWLLISAGAGRAYIDETGFTPLHCAVMKGNAALVKNILSDPGVDVNISAFDIGSPIVMAMKDHNKEIVDLLVNDKRFDKESRCYQEYLLKKAEFDMTGAKNWFQKFFKECIETKSLGRFPLGINAGYTYYKSWCEARGIPEEWRLEARGACRDDFHAHMCESLGIFDGVDFYPAYAKLSKVKMDSIEWDAKGRITKVEYKKKRRSWRIISRHNINSD